MSIKPNRNTVRRDGRCFRGATMALESLESRVLLNGLTVITHGAQMFGGKGSDDRPGWVDKMGQQVAARYGGNTAVYLLRIEPNGNDVQVTSFTRVSGAANSAASSSGETVLLVDWAEASNVAVSRLTADYSGTQIADAIMPYITTAFPASGITAPLGEGPIQLIGHSRGGSIISELAKDLGAVGMLVEQVTFLDPRPVPPDPLISLKTNVIFADDYFQNSGDSVFIPNGIQVNGAYNVGPLKVEGPGLDNTHNNVVFFYQGTIDLADPSVPVSWYSGNGLNRAATGFYFSRGGGGAWARPAAGLSAVFGGAASRATLSHTGGVLQWGNIASVNLSSYTVAAGQAFTTSFRYNSFNLNSTVQWFVDPDRNPYNNNSIAVGSPMNLGVTADAAPLITVNLAVNVAKGSYYVEGRVTNGAGTRYAYSKAVSVVNNPPTVALDVRGPAALHGWSVDTDAPAAAVTLQLNVDGVNTATTVANLSRPDLVAKYGSANHGYTFDLTGVSDGVHRIDIIAVDPVNGSATLVTSRTITTNQTPAGAIDWYDGSKLAGWAVDPDVSTASIQMRYIIDNNAPVFVTAAVTRDDLIPHYGSSNHGYSLILPQLSAGSHTIAVYGVDPVNKMLVLQGKRTATVVSPAGNPLPKGFLDSASTTRVAGWAQDTSNPTASINVRIDIDGVAGTPIAANLVRADLAASLGSTNHGYSMPLALTPGQHQVAVYAIDPVSSAAVLLASRVVGGGPPVGKLDVLSSTQIQGWANSAAIADGPLASAMIRIDIDGIPNPVFSTDVARGDISALYGQGTWGFAITTPGLTAGNHSVALIYIDALTLAPTTLVTRSLVI